MISPSTNKCCSGCKETKSRSEFVRNRSKHDGLGCYCKTCQSVRQRGWATKNKKLQDKITLAWRKNNPEKHHRIHNKAIKNWRAKNPKQAKCNTTTSNAIRDGRLLRPINCFFNNDNCSRKIEAHHSDYNNPLDVEWFCTAHHKAWHRVFKATP